MVSILLGHGFEEAEALVTADLLRRGGVEVALTSLGGPEVTGAHGITVKADVELTALDRANLDMVVLPGGMGGVEAISASAAARDLIQFAYDKGIYLAAICAAPTLLGAMGLLEGRSAVCYPGMEAGMTGAQPCLSTPVVVDGPIITGEAPGAAFDFGLKLVEVLKGSAVAEQVRDDAHYRRG